MTYKDFYTLLGESLNFADVDMFIAEYGTSVIFDNDPEGAAPDYEAVIADLTNIWELAHINITGLAARAGLSQSALARRFCIPLRTVQHWANGTRECPMYTKLMMAEILGLIKVERA